MANAKLAPVLALGSAQTLAWGSSYYLPAVLATPIARDLGVAPATVFAAFSVALLVSAALGPHAGADQRLQPALAVLLAHREVDVVVGRRAAAGPAGHAPGQGERHVGVTQGGGRALERLDDLGGLRRRLIRAHGGHLPRPAPVHHAAHRVMGGG